MGDRQASSLREYIFKNSTLINIESFPERDSKKKRVFESVKMSVCIPIIKNTKATPESEFTINIWDDKFKSTGLKTAFSFNDIASIDRVDFTIPRLRQEFQPIIIKMLSNQEVEIKCIEGELNVTFHKKYFNSDKNNPTILKGASIQRYYYTLAMSQGQIEYLDEVAYLQDNSKSNKSQHHNFERIAMQGMTGANDKIRLVMSIVPQGYYLANSCNYVLPVKEMSIKSLLAILNSKSLNWFFRCFSTNSNVNGYEVDNFPIPQLSEMEDNALTKLATAIIDKKKQGADTSAEEAQIDNIVYHLYNLTYDEVLIVDPETPITREEYESFNLNAYGQS